jgi:hypothetical protein
VIETINSILGRHSMVGGLIRLARDCIEWPPCESLVFLVEPFVSASHHFDRADIDALYGLSKGSVPQFTLRLIFQISKQVGDFA